MINEHCRQSIVVFTKLFECIYKFSAILKILKSARRSEAPFAVTSHLGPSLVLHPRFFLPRTSERLGLGWIITFLRCTMYTPCIHSTVYLSQSALIGSRLADAKRGGLNITHGSVQAHLSPSEPVRRLPIPELLHHLNCTRAVSDFILIYLSFLLWYVK
jgi:hypothetical protein